METVAVETVARETVTSEVDRPHLDLDMGRAKAGSPHFSSMSLSHGVFGAPGSLPGISCRSSMSISHPHCIFCPPPTEQTFL